MSLPPTFPIPPHSHSNRIFTPPRNRGGVIFLLQFVCVSVCVCLCVQNSCEQNSSRTDVPIWTRFSLNGCLQHWQEPYWNWWPWLKVKVTVTENVCKNDEKNSLINEKYKKKNTSDWKKTLLGCEHARSRYFIFVSWASALTNCTNGAWYSISSNSST